MQYLSLFLLTLAIYQTRAVGQSSNAVVQETRVYYSRWIGVQAPEFCYSLKDRQSNDSELRLRDYQGRRLLLMAFDSGDFVNRSCNEDALLKQLILLRNLRLRQGTNVVIIGFTYGPEFFMPGILDPSPEIKSVTEFPIVNSTKLQYEPLQEPYNLLQRWPSLLVIDKNGVFVGVYTPPLMESDIAKAFVVKDWSGSTYSPPREPPPAIVTNWSCRKFWVVYAYTIDLTSGSKFQNGFGHMKQVYFSDEVPADEVSSVKALEGQTLIRNVKAGEAIKQSDFEQKK
jgi:hypothetical protein